MRINFVTMEWRDPLGTDDGIEKLFLIISLELAYLEVNPRVENIQLCLLHLALFLICWLSLRTPTLIF